MQNHRRGLNPNEPNWGFWYERREVGVWVDREGKVLRVALLDEDGNKIPVDSPSIRTVRTQVRDIDCLVHREFGRLVGIELTPIQRRQLRES